MAQVRAAKLLIGKKIVGVRALSKSELKASDWYGDGVVIELEDGTLLIPQSDDEGNDSGTIRVQTPQGGEDFLVVMRTAAPSIPGVTL